MGLVRCPASGPLQLGGQGRPQTAWRALVGACRRLQAGCLGSRRPGVGPPAPLRRLRAHVLPEALRPCSLRRSPWMTQAAFRERPLLARCLSAKSDCIWLSISLVLSRTSLLILLKKLLQRDDVRSLNSRSRKRTPKARFFRRLLSWAKCPNGPLLLGPFVEGAGVHINMPRVHSVGHCLPLSGEGRGQVTDSFFFFYHATKPSSTFWTGSAVAENGDF